MDWVPAIVTFFLGLSSAVGLEWAKSEIQRRQSRKDRAEDFQRQALLDLQVALREAGHGLDDLLLRFAQERRADRSENDAITEQTEAAFRHFRKCMDSLGVVYPRVDDETIRTESSELIDLMAYMVEHNHSPEVSDQLRSELSLPYRALNQRIGDRLRKL